MKLSLIVAMSTNRVIGINNQMPWHLSADLKKFKAITMGSPIIMGRNTFESIGRPLPGRQNIIISRNPNYQQSGCYVSNDLDQVLQSLVTHEEVFVIGGAKLYASTIDRADRLYVTEIHCTFAGDTWFPPIQPEHWQEVEREDVNNDHSVDFNYSFIIYEH